MRIREIWLNQTEGHGIGDSDWYEPYTDDKGELFRAMQREYGGCTGKMWREVRVSAGFAAFGVTVLPATQDIRCGWIFERRERYEDAEAHWPDDKATYIRETWVEVEDAPAAWGWESKRP